MSEAFRLTPMGPVITAEMRAVRADQLAAQVEATGGVLTIAVGSGVCHCGEYMSHAGWDLGHSPVEMMEEVQVNAAQVESLVRGIQEAVDKHRKCAGCPTCNPLHRALKMLNARSI